MTAGGLRRIAALTCVAALAFGSTGWSGASPDDDAGTGADAGDGFEDATSVAPAGAYTGMLGGGDVDDWYRFPLAEGRAISVLIESDGVDLAEMRDPDGRLVDAGARPLGATISANQAFTGEGSWRIAVHRALVAGEYRLRLSSSRVTAFPYSLCFLNCEQPRTAPIDFVFGGALRSPKTKVLLVPPAHGDLGDPNGPTVLDYIDATLRGIRRWEPALGAFADRYPQYDYLRQIDVDVTVFDGVAPIRPVGYDVVIVYVAAGPAFRGIAWGGSSTQETIEQLGLDEWVHHGGRVIALSLYGASPRAGQVMWDFPEENDLENVTMHEFGHTFGLGHTLWWDASTGPDLMNSPATFIYGNGFPVGDGGERTTLDCLSSLDLFGMSQLYRWLPNGVWLPTSRSMSLPPGIPYELFC